MNRFFYDYYIAHDLIAENLYAKQDEVYIEIEYRNQYGFPISALPFNLQSTF